MSAYLSVPSLKSNVYQSNRTTLSLFEYEINDSVSGENEASFIKPKTIQTNRVTLVVVLKGNIDFEFRNYKQTCTIGESLIIPPHQAVRLETKKENIEKRNAHNDKQDKKSKHKKNSLWWLELQIPIETINLTISQYNKTENLEEVCKLKVKNNLVWQFGDNPINITHDTSIKKAITRLTDLFTEDHYNKDAFIDFAIKELVLRFVRTPARDRIGSEKTENKDNETENETNPSIEAVLEYIKEHIDEPISIDTLTNIASMSKAAFFRTFKESLDISPIDYINRERIEIAKDRLVDISKSVTDICYELGYNHMTYFIRVFKKYEGITPKQFQIKQNKENRENSNNE